MLFPIKLKLAQYEAEAVRQYLQRMVGMSLDPAAKNEVIILAEHFEKFDNSVRAKFFKSHRNQIATYTLPLSVARILWYRWQVETRCERIQEVLGKIDYELNSKNRIPIFPKALL